MATRETNTRTESRKATVLGIDAEKVLAAFDIEEAVDVEDVQVRFDVTNPDILPDYLEADLRAAGFDVQVYGTDGGFYVLSPKDLPDDAIAAVEKAIQEHKRPDIEVLTAEESQGAHQLFAQGFVTEQQANNAARLLTGVLLRIERRRNTGTSQPEVPAEEAAGGLEP